MPNYNNKVELSDGTVLMDLTSDTVTPGSMVQGTTAHDRSGAAITGSLGPATQSSDGLMSSADKTKLDGISDGFTGSYRPEAGRILPYGGTTAPEGYLLCDGEAYSRTEYSELFEVIGTTFGAGDGSTTFNVPDLRGRTSIGANASYLLGATGGAETHRHSYAVQLGAYYSAAAYEGDTGSGVVNMDENTVAGWDGGQDNTTSAINNAATATTKSVSHLNRRSTANSGSSSTMQPYQVVNYIICTGKLGYAGIKGDKGDTGDTGAAAGFGTPTATVDSNVGTPSVTVTATGPDTAKVFEFEFENMKGEKGDRGEPITVDNFVPVAAGLIYPYAGSTAPTGYLMCDGAAVSRITYADLFEAIGTTYGAGDGETTFNVPDLRGRVPLGSSTDYALGSTGGEASHTLQESEMPSHSHTMNHGHGFTQPTVNGGATTTSSKSLTGWTAMYKDTGMFDPGNSYRSGVITIGGQRSASYRPGWTSGVSRDLNISASHDHPQVAHTHSVTGGAVSDHSGSTGNKGDGGAHNNLQPYTATNYIISTGFEYGGLQGEAAGFGTPTASVDSGYGTPSVTVTASGPDTAKVFDFEFSNLKGDQGIQGPQGPQGPKGDTGDMASGFYVGTTEPQGNSYFFWYNPLNGAVKVKQYVEPDSLTDGGWAWREMVFADEGKNGDIYMATADELEEAVPAN